MNVSSIEKNLQFLKENFDRQIQALADQVRAEVIIPLCQKHNLQFTSGMGVYFFSQGRKTFDYSDRDSSSYKRLGLKKAFDLLNLEVSYNRTLGDYMCDYPSDNG